MSYLSDRERKRTTNTPAYVSEIGIVGGTSSLATVRARQMARQREISSAHSPTSRRLRTDDYLKNLYLDEEKEEKERARAKASLLDDQKLEQLTARADRVRLRTDELSALEKAYSPLESPGQSSEVPYSVRRQKRLADQYRRQSDERREQVSKDLARARALLDEERKRENVEIAKDIKKGYGSYTNKRSTLLERDEIGLPRGRGEPATTSILKTTTRRRFEIEDDYQPLGRTRVTDDRYSDLSLGRSNGLQRELGGSSSRGASSRLSNEPGSRTSKEVHWSVDDF